MDKTGFSGKPASLSARFSVSPLATLAVSVKHLLTSASSSVLVAMHINPRIRIFGQWEI